MKWDTQLASDAAAHTVDRMAYAVLIGGKLLDDPGAAVEEYLDLVDRLADLLALEAEYVPEKSILPEPKKADNAGELVKATRDFKAAAGLVEMCLLSGGSASQLSKRRAAEKLFSPGGMRLLKTSAGVILATYGHRQRRRLRSA